MSSLSLSPWSSVNEPNKESNSKIEEQLNRLHTLLEPAVLATDKMTHKLEDIYDVLLEIKSKFDAKAIAESEPMEIARAASSSLSCPASSSLSSSASSSLSSPASSCPATATISSSSLVGYLPRLISSLISSNRF